jgi:hypothetical protein
MTVRAWTTPDDLRRMLRKEWDRGALLRGEVDGLSAFPFRFRMTRPTNAELSSRFDDVRKWARALVNMPDVRVESREQGTRSIGRNEIPAAVWVDDLDAAARLLDTCHELALFRATVALTRTKAPMLMDWLATRPMEALGVANDWSRVLDVVDWMRSHPNPGIYVRQVDIPGVDTKFIERHGLVLRSMLDNVLPTDAVATEHESFARRYGFRPVPQTVRIRAIDPALVVLPGAQDRPVTLTLEDFTLLRGAERVFITENYVNFLAFPRARAAIVVFGEGYDVGKIAKAAWVHDVPVYYWGDIDTHGFAILDHLRSVLPNVVSLLMDHGTLHAHEAQWGHEPMPIRRDLLSLTRDERSLYDDIRDNLIRSHLRFEQERTAFHLVVEAIDRAVGSERDTF